METHSLYVDKKMDCCTQTPKKEILILQKRYKNAVRNFKQKRLIDVSYNNDSKKETTPPDEEDGWLLNVIVEVKNTKLDLNPKSDVKSLKHQSLSVIKSLIKHRLYDLSCEEKPLMRFCEHNMNKFEAIEIRIQTSKNKYEINKSSNKILPEVFEFQEYVAKHNGHFGGWEEFDHTTFLKHRKKYQNIHNIKLKEDLVEILFGQTLETVDDHIKWFLEYCSKKRQMKLALFRWRSLKEKEKEDMKQQIENSSTVDIKNEIQRKLMKENIQKWRIKCEELKQKQDLIRDQDKKAKLMQDIKCKEKQREIKVLLERRKILKEEEAKILQGIEDEKKIKKNKDKQKMANCKIKEFRQKDFEKITDQIRRKENEETKRKMKEKQFEAARIKISVTKDPKRILKPTKAWLAYSSTKKVRPIKSVTINNYYMLLNQIKHRSIPNLRNS